MAMIALMLWQWYKSRGAGGGAEAPEPMPSPRGQARIPSDDPVRVPQSAPAQIPSPSSGGDSDSDFGTLANPKNMQLPGAAAAEGAAGQWMTTKARWKAPVAAVAVRSATSSTTSCAAVAAAACRCRAATKRWTIRASACRAAAVADAMPRGRGGDGGLGDILGEILGGGRGMPGQRVAGGPQSDPLSDLLQSAGIGGLGGLLAGGASGGVLGGLLQQFDQAGRGDAARSWVSSGENVPVTPKDVENTFGSDIIDQIAEQFGMDKNELLKGLSQMLPQVVDQLTPDGRLPTEQELSRRG